MKHGMRKSNATLTERMKRLNTETSFDILTDTTVALFKYRNKYYAELERCVRGGFITVVIEITYEELKDYENQYEYSSSLELFTYEDQGDGVCVTLEDAQALRDKELEILSNIRKLINNEINVVEFK